MPEGLRTERLGRAGLASRREVTEARSASITPDASSHLLRPTAPLCRPAVEDGVAGTVMVGPPRRVRAVPAARSQCPRIRSFSFTRLRTSSSGSGSSLGKWSEPLVHS